MSIERYLDSKNDIAFKKIFGEEKNKDVLIAFLNDILKKDDEVKIKEITFINPSQTPETKYQKQSIIDVLCVDDIGTKFIVEMQVAKVGGFEKRAQYYAAKAYASQINQGDPYSDLKEIIFLAIVDFVMFPDKPGYKSDHVILDVNSHTRDLKDFSFTFIELPKFKKDKIEELETNEDRWCYFFKHSSESEDMNNLLYSIKHDQKVKGAEKEESAIEKAYKTLASYNWSEDELVSYEAVKKANMDARAREQQVRWEGKEEGIEIGFGKGEAIGLEKGIKVGIEETMKEIAKKMLQAGQTEEFVSEITGLSLEQIKALRS